MSIKRWFLALGVLFALSGCGQKGDLYIPESAETSAPATLGQGS